MSISTQITVVATAEQIIVTAPGALRGPIGDVTPEVTALVERAEAGASQASASADSAAGSAESASGYANSAAADAADALESKVASAQSQSAAEAAGSSASASASAASSSAAEAASYAELAASSVVDIDLYVERAESASEAAGVYSGEAQAGALEATDAAASAQEGKQSAAQSATVAVDAANASLLLSGIYASTAVGISATTPGKVFGVPVANDTSSLILYENRAGVAVDTGARLPSTAAVDAIRNKFADSNDLLLGVTDDAGFAALEATRTSFKTSDIELSVDRIRMGDIGLERAEGYALAAVDDFGFVVVLLDADGKQSGAAPVVSGFTKEDILQANQQGLLSAANVVREFNTEVARPIWDYNHFLQDSQSLGTDFEGWPALSKTPRLGNMMLGNSVRPASRTNPEFIPLGVSVLTPMKSVVQDATTGGTILTDAQVAALAPGASNEGESSVVSMVNFAKSLHNKRLQTANDTSRTFIGSSCGVNGRTIEQLSKGNPANLWLRLTQAAEKVKAIATTEGKSYGIAGVSFLQGEYNYSTAFGGVDTLSGYKEKLSTFYNDIETDIVSVMAGQSQPPLFMTYQTGASFTKDANNLAIGMAQWELSKERRNWVMATPIYQFPDKGGHLTANSYRWMGKQFAKVWHRVVEMGQDWKPLSPLAAVVKDRKAMITFHVPHPPLAFDTPYVGRTATDYATKGFTALDDSGALLISSVEIVADCVIVLTFTRVPVGQVYIRYADKTVHNGNGCLRDSDPTISDDLYEYTAGSGQYADENIAALVGKPYPLHNWCIAFHIPATGAQ